MAKVTMQTIADNMGISKVTVSKALSGKDGVSAQLRGEIIETASKLGYVAQAAQTPNNDEYGILGVLVGEVFFEKDENFYSRLFKNLYNSAIEQKHFLIMNKIAPCEMQAGIAPPVYSCKGLRGILILGQMKKSYVEYLSQLNIPLVLVDFYYQGLKLDCVTTDNLYAMYGAVNYLYSLGHRKIGFLGNQRQTSSIQDRYLGYCKSLMEHNLPIVPEYTISERNDNGEQIDIVLPKDMPTAFACNSDQAASTLCKKLKASGYKIPDDISIIGFDNISHGTICEPPLTTVNVNRREMAKLAIDTILRRIKHSDSDIRNIVCRTNIVERSSVASK